MYERIRVGVFSVPLFALVAVLIGTFLAVAEPGSISNDARLFWEVLLYTSIALAAAMVLALSIDETTSSIASSIIKSEVASFLTAAPVAEAMPNNRLTRSNSMKDLKRSSIVTLYIALCASFAACYSGIVLVNEPQGTLPMLMTVFMLSSTTSAGLLLCICTDSEFFVRDNSSVAVPNTVPKIANFMQAIATAKLDASVGIAHAPLAGDADFRLHVTKLMPGSKVKAHSHGSGGELYFIYSGSGHVYTGRSLDSGAEDWFEPVAVQAGDTFAVVPSMLHQLHNTGDTELVLIFGCPDSHLASDRVVVADYPLTTEV